MKKLTFLLLVIMLFSLSAVSQKWSYYLNGKTIIDLKEDRSGSLWVITSDDGAFRITGEKIEEFTIKNGLSYSDLKTVFIDSKNRVWFGTGKTGITADGKGICVLDGTQWKYYTEKDGLASNAVFSFYEDLKGRMWCGTAKGICLLKGERWETIDEISPARFTAPIFFEDSEKNVWFAYERGIFKFNENGITTFDENKGLAIKPTLSWTRGADGNYWFGHVRRHFSKFDGSKFETFDVGNFRAGALWLFKGSYLYEPVFVFSDSRKVMWIASQGAGGGLFTLKNGELTQLHEEEGVLKPERINQICEDNKGNIWFANLYKGANRFDGSKWYQFTTPELPHNQVNKIFIDSKNIVWFATFKGLVKLEL